MSRIGRLPISVPEGVDVKIANSVVTVKGAKGELSQDIQPGITVEMQDKHLVVKRASDERNLLAFQGLYRQLINNMIQGVSAGFVRTLLINGVGYRAEQKKSAVLFNLGYSNSIEFVIPEDITVDVEESGIKVLVKGIDKARVGKVAAEIRALRPPEPYKGKGIQYEDEVIKRKVGKSGVK